MPLNVSYIPQESRLDLSFHGNLDLTLSQDVCEVLSTMPADLECCIIDLSEIDRLFDSGVALLQALHRRLKADRGDAGDPERPSGDAQVVPNRGAPTPGR